MIASRRLLDDDVSACARFSELLGSILLQKKPASARKRAILINLGGDVIEARAQGAAATSRERFYPPAA
jgi:hypothetical protein